MCVFSFSWTFRTSSAQTLLAFTLLNSFGFYLCAEEIIQERIIRERTYIRSIRMQDGVIWPDGDAALHQSALISPLGEVNKRHDDVDGEAMVEQAQGKAGVEQDHEQHGQSHQKRTIGHHRKTNIDELVKSRFPQKVAFESSMRDHVQQTPTTAAPGATTTGAAPATTTGASPGTTTGAGASTTAAPGPAAATEEEEDSSSTTMLMIIVVVLAVGCIMAGLYQMAQSSSSSNAGAQSQVRSSASDRRSSRARRDTRDAREKSSVDDTREEANATDPPPSDGSAKGPSYTGRSSSRYAKRGEDKKEEDTAEEKERPRSSSRYGKPRGDDRRSGDDAKGGGGDQDETEKSPRGGGGSRYRRNG